jgi:rod shape-determining protein MreB
MDEAIIDYIKREYNMMVGERTAEDIKIRIGCVFDFGEEEFMEVRGRDLVNGLPCTATIGSTEIRQALKDPAQAIVQAVKQTLEITPPELSGDIVESGLTLSGGTAQLRGLDLLLANETGMPVQVAKSPMDCVVTGACIALEELNGMRRQLQRDHGSDMENM